MSLPQLHAFARDAGLAGPDPSSMRGLWSVLVPTAQLPLVMLPGDGATPARPM